MELTIHWQILLGAFLIASVLGAVVQKSHFCTLGAVSDWVNMGDTGRVRAWFLAIAVAVCGVLMLEALGLADLRETRPPYRTANFAWTRYLLGGLMFGVGMTLASGCTTKNLARLGGGSLKALTVLIVVGAFAYLMTKTSFYAVMFHSWMQPLSVDLAALGRSGQDIGAVLAGELGGVAEIRRVAAGLLAMLLLFIVLRAGDFRRSFDNVLGGVVVGTCVVLGWYLTGGPWGQAWIEAVAWMDEPPLGVGVQSYTFVNPMAEVLVYLARLGDARFLTFGVAAAAGVFSGALCYSVSTRHFRIEWFSSRTDFLRHVGGGALMGIGGVLAMGCTIGQGVTGVATLALGSMLTLGAVILGSATTMKIEYYKMLYEDASLLDALLSGWADMRLIPQSMRRLEAL
jgi:uncharacterized membrane protein YedE/YeeE